MSRPPESERLSDSSRGTVFFTSPRRGEVGMGASAAIPGEVGSARRGCPPPGSRRGAIRPLPSARRSGRARSLSSRRSSRRGERVRVRGRARENPEHRCVPHSYKRRKVQPSERIRPSPQPSPHREERWGEGDARRSLRGAMSSRARSPDVTAFETLVSRSRLSLVHPHSEEPTVGRRLEGWMHGQSWGHPSRRPLPRPPQDEGGECFADTLLDRRDRYNAPVLPARCRRG